MKNVIIVSLAGKAELFIEQNGKLIDYEDEEIDKHYSTVMDNGITNFLVIPDEIPYSKGHKTIEDIYYYFGDVQAPLFQYGINVAKKNKSELGKIYFVTESILSPDLEVYARALFKGVIGKDAYGGSISYVELLYSIGMALGVSAECKYNIVAPNMICVAEVDKKQKAFSITPTIGIEYSPESLNDIIFNEFDKRFAYYLNLFDDYKNKTLIRGMFLAGYYGYIYEGKEDDIINVYQDRKIVLPFKEIKDFIDYQIKAFKDDMDKNVPTYCVNIPTLKEYFKEFNLEKNFLLGQDSIVLYTKMLLDFNNDMSVKPYKMRNKGLILYFGNNNYGRKSKEFCEKQKAFIANAYKNQRKK